MSVDTHAIRNRFPALSRRVGNRTAVYLDGPGGTQVPVDVIEAMSAHLRDGAANLGGYFEASRDSEAAVAAARAAVAGLFNAELPEQIVFGQNMTSLTFAASRSLARTWDPGYEIVLTQLDHDANVWPWVREAEERGVTVKYALLDAQNVFSLSVGAVEAQLTERTRLVAVTHASNSLGTLVDVGAVTRAAHEVGALTYIDAVHYAPHGQIDVRDYDCDFLVASAYKFFGPHTGVMYGRHELLAELDPPRLQLAPAMPPGRWETGTQSFESLAGVAAAVNYLASLSDGIDRRESLRSAMDRIASYERSLSDRFLAGIGEIPGVSLYGVDVSEGRTPTFSIDIAGISPSEAAEQLGRFGIFAWSGHNYAIGVMERLGRLDKGGLLRVGFVHYTVAEEIDLLLAAVDRLAAGRDLRGL